MQLGCGLFESTIKAKAKLSGEDILSQHIDNLKFIKIEGIFYTIQHSIYLGFEGSYGFLGRGNLDQKVSWDSFNSQTCYLTKGKSADLGVQFGYKFYLTPYHLNVTSLMPKFGYSGFFMDVEDKALRKTPTIAEGFSLDRSKGVLKQRWYGPFLGGALEIKTYQGFGVTLSYDYYFFSLINNSFASFNFSDGSVLKLKSKKSYGGGYGHHPKASVSFDINNTLKFGASLNYLYFKEKSSSTTVKNLTDHIPLNTSGSYQREDLSVVLFMALVF
ncbi:hypothetical protein COB11_01350 [Candidatus Aerophobetes bacterium]|uniref:Protochlamydia outer membrane protein domain-containing protein n=1 Tax=Aerophobetes bacterium TaxID=2030807 RepID=A0A2A4YLH9_UNCAE|nr:MAG: hypothetical protein COB11_01350 [Candidatus Aerophobetes bacterium]